MVGHRALLVGLDHYSNSTHIPELHGAVNDVNEMANLLYRFGFGVSDISIITNERATSQNILEKLSWLGQRKDKDNRLLFYFAGYGSHLIDERTGIPTEILCPYDFDFTSKNGLFSNNLRNSFSKSNQNFDLQVILDTGFSKPLVVDNNPRISGIRYLQPPLDIEFHVLHSSNVYLGKFLRTPPGISRHHDVYISDKASLALWLAAAPNQPCYEAELNSIHGVFSFYFCKVIKETGFNISRERLCYLVYSAIQESGFNQTPVLSTSREDGRGVSAAGSVPSSPWPKG
jgi:hypothetical protein